MSFSPNSSFSSYERTKSNSDMPSSSSGDRNEPSVVIGTTIIIIILEENLLVRKCIHILHIHIHCVEYV